MKQEKNYILNRFPSGDKKITSFTSLDVYKVRLEKTKDSTKNYIVGVTIERISIYKWSVKQNTKFHE